MREGGVTAVLFYVYLEKQNKKKLCQSHRNHIGSCQHVQQPAPSFILRWWKLAITQFFSTRRVALTAISIGTQPAHYCIYSISAEQALSYIYSICGATVKALCPIGRDIIWYKYIQSCLFLYLWDLYGSTPSVHQRVINYICKTSLIP
jgi:hypothetical protein